MIQVPASSPVRELLQSPFPVPSSSQSTGLGPVPFGASRRPGSVSVPLPPSVPTSPIVITDTPARLQQHRPIDLTSSHDFSTRNNNDDDIDENSVMESTSPSVQRSFADITSRFKHDPTIPSSFSSSTMTTRKRPAEEASASALDDRRVRHQTGPLRAMPVPVDELAANPFDDVPNIHERNKLQRMQRIFLGVAPHTLRQALTEARGNYDAAVDAIASRVDRLQASDLAGTATQSAPVAAATRRHLVTHKSIREKWSGIGDDGDVGASAPQSRPKRRLIRGRKTAILVPSDTESGGDEQDDDDDDDNIDQDSDSEQDDDDGDDSDSDAGPARRRKQARRPGQPMTGPEKVEATVVRFLNTATPKQLTDLLNQPEDVIDAIVASRPYKTLDHVRAVTIESSAAKRARTRKVGDRMADLCVEMFEGYAAVDSLVASCQHAGRPLTEAIERWGFAVSADQGEMEIVGGDDSKDNGDDDDDVVTNNRRSEVDRKNWLEKPAMMAPEIELKDYQIVGLNWLNLLYKHRLSGILGDDMGLGKTCQVISFLSHLAESGVPNPHLVVVPGSTLENWLREMKKFSPKLRVEPYYGSQNERAEQRENILRRRNRINVVVTTYDVAWRPEDCHFLRKLSPTVAVFDEGHTLKNQQSKRHAALMRIPAQSRILLTGTPLQNNLQELVSLLAFLLPRLFQERSEALSAIFKYKARTSDSNHDGLLADARTSRAKSILTPFILRRKKHQVLKHLPKKTHHVVMCDLDDAQREVYDGIVDRQRDVLLARERGEATATATANVLVELRKAALHPLLFRNLYDDGLIGEMAVAAVREHEFRNSDVEYVLEDMSVYTDFNLHRLCEDHPTHLGRYALDPGWVFKSGKITALRQLLARFDAAGERTLIFSQFTSMMDILERVLAQLDIQFCRLDGSTPVSERQDLIDTFTTDPSIKVFMLSTKAGGTGINLIAATKVVIFDLSFNPQEDVQAENRAHRVGQTKDVDVYRLVSRGTVEEQIHALGVSKLALDECVSGEIGSDEAVRKAKAAASSMASSGSGDGDGDDADVEAITLVSRMLAEQLSGQLARPKKASESSSKASSSEPKLGKPKRSGVSVGKDESKVSKKKVKASGGDDEDDEVVLVAPPSPARSDQSRDKPVRVRRLKKANGKGDGAAVKTTTQTATPPSSRCSKQPSPAIEVVSDSDLSELDSDGPAAETTKKRRLKVKGSVKVGENVEKPATAAATAKSRPKPKIKLTTKSDANAGVGVESEAGAKANPKPKPRPKPVAPASASASASSASVKMTKTKTTKTTDPEAAKVAKAKTVKSPAAKTEKTARPVKKGTKAGAGAGSRSIKDMFAAASQSSQ